MKKRSRLIRFIITACLLIIIYVSWQLFGPVINAPQEKYFYIKTGSIYQNVKDSLAKKKIISNTYVFNAVSKYLHYDILVKPGRYRITDGMNVVNLIRMLRAGNQSPVNLVINKLRTNEDLIKKIADNFEPGPATISHFINNNDSLAKYNLDTNTVLTAVIPNTYTFVWNTPVQKLFSRLFAEKEKFWNSDRKAAAAALGLSEQQAYILASIVEEETNRQEDKGKVASVYLNRLQAGMKLAADPTVKFALKDFGLKRIMYKHLSYISPYNTYLNMGLPPGPICTPSIKTIDAVLHAPATNYLYFVARPDFSGYSNFATTYEEHKKNARAYQQALDSVILLKQGMGKVLSN